jgi:hypothetical protein
MYVVLTIPVKDTVRNVQNVKEKASTLGGRS